MERIYIPADSTFAPGTATCHVFYIAKTPDMLYYNPEDEGINDEWPGLYLPGWYWSMLEGDAHATSPVGPFHTRDGAIESYHSTKPEERCRLPLLKPED